MNPKSVVEPAAGAGVDPAHALRRMRAARPLVHCITNYVAMNPAANVLLAAGASPAMVHAPEEVGDLAAVAGALTVNIGTLSTPWLSGMQRAVAAARGASVPWVLDPVAHFISPFRREATADLVARGPAILRGNASEILALAGAGGTGRGADAGDDVASAEGAARNLAARLGATVAVTGEVDFVTDGSRAWRVRGGHVLMPQVTALGCALTALCGGYVAVARDPAEASLAALAHFAVAGARAGEAAAGPGSFAVAFLDALAAVQPDDLPGAVEPA